MDAGNACATINSSQARSGLLHFSGCRSCKPGDIRDRGLYSTLPIPHCAYLDYTDMPKFGGYDFALVVTCGLTRFTRVFPCTKQITGEETIKILLDE